MFNRAKQFTEERLGKAERTENDAAFESLSKRTDKIKGYTEKLVKNSEAVLVPNPAARLETFMFDTLPVDKIGVTNTRLTNLEYLGADMIEAGNEFGTGTPYGSALIRVGQTEQALGEIEREYIKNSHSAFIGPLGTFLEVFRGDSLHFVLQKEFQIWFFFSYLGWNEKYHPREENFRKSKTWLGRLQRSREEGESNAATTAGNTFWSF